MSHISHLLTPFVRPAAGLKRMAAAAFLVGAAGFAASAQADILSWSVGVASPGVSIGVTNARGPVYVQPAPIYMQPAPIYVRPAPVFVQPQAYYVQPGPVYYQVPVYQSGWAPPARAYGWDDRNAGRHHGWKDVHGKHDRDHDGRPDGPRPQAFNGPQGYEQPGYGRR